MKTKISGRSNTPRVGNVLVWVRLRGHKHCHSCGSDPGSQRRGRGQPASMGSAPSALLQETSFLLILLLLLPRCSPSLVFVQAEERSCTVCVCPEERRGTQDRLGELSCCVPSRSTAMPVPAVLVQSLLHSSSCIFREEKSPELRHESDLLD